MRASSPGSTNSEWAERACEMIEPNRRLESSVFEVFGGYMPIMVMKPPSGIRLKEYSVSPIFFLNSLGPKPIA